MFDFLTTQNAIRECWSPRELFTLWDRLCSLKLKGELPVHQYDELRDQIFRKFKELNAIKSVMATLLFLILSVCPVRATTIAWDGRAIACDSQYTSDTVKEVLPMKKIVRINGDLVGSSGKVKSMESFNKWYCDKKQSYPLLDEDFEALVVTRNGAFSYSAQNQYPTKVSAPYALGHGREVAYGALKSGASAKKAVEVAATTDLYTGFPVFSFTLEGK